MNNNTFPNSIGRYILQRGGEDMDVNIDVDADIDLFEITKFNYRTLFDKSQNVNYREILGMFEIENVLDLDMDHVRLHYRDHPHEWKQLFIFFFVMPFTEYEFQGVDGKLF